MKTYSDLIKLKSFEDRYDYLNLDGKVSELTFGSNRYLNQNLYRSYEWRKFRKEIIIRDRGLDLGVDGYEINGKIIVHHINPLTIEDIINRSYKIFDYENVVSTSLNTHNAIHYADKTILNLDFKERSKNDTCLWKK